jgi:DNA polymerase I-like protein with 3'-5' exonuclease and polymerase domains
MATNNANQPEGPLVWVMDPSSLQALIEACRTSAEVVVDLETTGLDEYATTGGPSNGGVAARISLASFTLPQSDSFGMWNGDVPTTYVLPLSHPDSPWLGVWRKTMTRVMNEGVVATRRWVTNQNVKFDARWIFALCGIDISSLILWDTQISSHMLDENETTRLKGRVPIEFANEGVEAWNDFALDYPGASEKVPLLELGEYAARDTWWTWRLAQKHRSDMFVDGGGYPVPIVGGHPEAIEDYQTAKFGLLAKWVSMPTTASLTRMEQNGIRLDIPWTKDRLLVEQLRKEEGLDKMSAVYGQDRAKASGAATSLWFKELTTRAVADDKLRIVSMTRNGNPQWNKGVLAKLDRQGFELATVIRDQRQGTKLAEYLSSWLGFVSSDGKIHSTYRAGHVVTGRLSSANPNMQQVTKQLRPAFIPSSGYYLADFDFSQLELRIAAFVARCEPMLEAFARGEDLHRLLGAKIVADRNQRDNARLKNIQWRFRHKGERNPDYPVDSGEMYVVPPTDRELAWFADHKGGYPYEEDQSKVEVTPKDRQGAKSANFGLLYLQSPEGYREYAESVYGVVLTIEEAAQFHAAFFEQWTGMHAWHEKVKKQLAHDGYVTSPIGRVRRLPGIWSSQEWERSAAERQAVNSPVQGTGSDLMQVAAADIQGLLPGTKAVPGVRLVATVHDSIVAELPIGHWQESAAEVKRRMENAGQWFRKLGVTLDVPIVADVTVGTRWSLDDISNPQEAAA